MRADLICLKLLYGLLCIVLRDHAYRSCSAARVTAQHQQLTQTNHTWSIGLQLHYLQDQQLTRSPFATRMRTMTPGSTNTLHSTINGQLCDKLLMARR